MASMAWPASIRLTHTSKTRSHPLTSSTLSMGLPQLTPLLLTRTSTLDSLFAISPARSLQPCVVVKFASRGMHTSGRIELSSLLAERAAGRQHIVQEAQVHPRTHAAESRFLSFREQM